MHQHDSVSRRKHSPQRMDLSMRFGFRCFQSHLRAKITWQNFRTFHPLTESKCMTFNYSSTLKMPRYGATPPFSYHFHKPWHLACQSTRGNAKKRRSCGKSKSRVPSWSKSPSTMRPGSQKNSFQSCQLVLRIPTGYQTDFKLCNMY